MGRNPTGARRVPLLSPVGWAIVGVGFLLLAALYLDRSSEFGEMLMGTVTQAYWVTPRYGTTNIHCTIRVDDEAMIEDTCQSLVIGARVPVCKLRRRITGIPIYSGGPC